MAPAAYPGGRLDCDSEEEKGVVWLWTLFLA